MGKKDLKALPKSVRWHYTYCPLADTLSPIHIANCVKTHFLFFKPKFITDCWKKRSYFKRLRAKKGNAINNQIEKEI